MKESSEIFLDLAWRRYEGAEEDKRELDTKASILLTAAGVLLGFVASAWNNLDKTAALISIVSLGVCAVACIWSLKNRTYYPVGINAMRSALRPCADNPSCMVDQLYDKLGWAEDNARKNIKSMGHCYDVGIWTFLLGLFLVILALFLETF